MSAIGALKPTGGDPPMLPQMIAFRAAMTRTGELAKPRPANETR
jgi:hypothetical protein